QVLDYAIRQEDAQGEYWVLASGNPVLDGTGAAIARATLADIRSQTVGAGQEWRIESFGPAAADQPYDQVAFYIRDGIVTDYTVWIEDAEGRFAIWSSNLQRALDNQAAYGPGQFGLRGYALDL